VSSELKHRGLELAVASIQCETGGYTIPFLDKKLGKKRLPEEALALLFVRPVNALRTKNFGGRRDNSLKAVKIGKNEEKASKRSQRL